MPDTSATREQQRLEWAREATGAAHAALLRASTDAGFRSYWRTDGIAPPLIVMDSPPEQEDVAPWLQVRDLLEGGGVRVPRVLAEDRARGFLLLEDLGADTLLHVLDPDNADALVEASLAELLRLQAIPVPAGFPAYDRALLERELGLFDAWFLERHLGVVLDDTDREALASAGTFLVARALAQPQVLVHRDYMPRNLMPVAGGVAVLDFQDAVRGPLAYDPTSLFKDAFLSWPAARVEAWLERYHALAIDAGLPVPSLARFHEDAALIGVQRHLKVLGIFARLHHRDGKPKYLADAPRFVAYLDEVVPRYPALSGLDRLLDRHVRPVFAAGAGAVE